MNREAYKQIQTELLVCAQGDRFVEDLLIKWFRRYVHEFGASEMIDRAHSEGAIDRTRDVREYLHRRIAERICLAEAAVETLEPIPNGHERKAQVYVVFDPSSNAKSVVENKKADG